MPSLIYVIVLEKKTLGYETKRIRTSDPQFRKLMLYPAELWSHSTGE